MTGQVLKLACSWESAVQIQAVGELENPFAISSKTRKQTFRNIATRLLKPMSESKVQGRGMLSRYPNAPQP